MEIELLLRETLRQGEFFIRDGMDSHRLKFVEEQKNDGEEEHCVKCKKPAILGPFFQCNRLILHVACFGTAYNYHDYIYESTLCFHFGNRHGQLIFSEELKNDAEGRAVCIACQGQVEGHDPGYKCSASECNFLLHKSCALLPRQIQHPLHPSHILILKVPTETFSYCNACGKWCSRCLFYSCNECDFNLDSTCATRTQVNSSDDCQHTFLPLFKQMHFTCEICGEEGTDFASSCIFCPLFIHSKCSKFPCTIDISIHDHFLTLINSLHQVKDSNDVIFCKICYQKVKKDYASYYCQECDFVAHLHCTDAYRFASARIFREQDSNYQPQKSINVGEKINPSEIQHFSHPGDLILSYDEVLHDELCDGCMQFIISAPFYKCTQCNFFLHTTCALLPRQKKHLLHPHTLILLSHALYKFGVFTCDACAHSRHGFVYRCDTCDYNLDAKCCSIPETLKHEGHQHSLFLAISSNKICNACDHGYKHPKYPGVFVCTACDFALGFECATLPLIAGHRYDEHPLALTYVAEDKFGEYYCLICEEEMNPKHWFYYCVKCDFSAHCQCVLGKYPYIDFESTYKSTIHQHPITFVRKTEYSSPCDACGKTFDGMALECIQCKFNVHVLNSECIQKISNEVQHP